MKKNISINDMNSTEQLLILKDVCNRIYIARNISLNEKTIHECLVKIDELFKDRDNFN